MSLVTPRCTLHPGQSAAWRCLACRRSLCPACAVEVELLPTHYLRCAPCGGAVEVLTHPGSDRTFPRALGGALLLPVGLPGLCLLLALAWGAARLDRLQGWERVAALLGWSVAAWTVGVAIVRATADGSTTLAGVQAAPWRDLFRPALAAAALTAPALWVPRTGPRGALLALGGALLLTPLLLGVVSGDGPGRGLSPVRALGTLLRLGADGVLAAVCVGAIWLFVRMLAGLAEAPPGELPSLWISVLTSVGPLSLFLVPRVLGLLVEARGEDLGYRFQARGRVPLFPGARPALTRVHRAPEPAPRAPVAAIALDDTAVPGRLELEPFAPEGEREE